jgi:hypothetical protein
MNYSLASTLIIVAWTTQSKKSLLVEPGDSCLPASICRFGAIWGFPALRGSQKNA